MNNDLTLELPNFTGPLDLLLHLIKSQKIDIYDIPIAKITGQYLSYLSKWQKLNLDIAGEYFVMASSLLRIKSQDLLPKNDFDIQDEPEAEDLKNELVEQLIQYSVFKKIANYFKEQNKVAPILFSKEPSISEHKDIEPLPLGEITSNQLANTFALVINRFKMNQPDAASIEVHETSIEEMNSFLTKELKTNPKLSFFKCVGKLVNLDQVISFFLAILEMCRNKKIKVTQNLEFNDLIVERTIT